QPLVRVPPRPRRGHGHGSPPHREAGRSDDAQPARPLQPPMKALLLYAPPTLDLVDLPAPTPAPGEVLLRVRACGICGSDIHGWDGSTGRRRPPLIMGHEASGEIAALGPRVEGWRIGDRVTFDSTISCGRCGYCRDGQ